MPPLPSQGARVLYPPTTSTTENLSIPPQPIFPTLVLSCLMIYLPKFVGLLPTAYHEADQCTIQETFGLKEQRIYLLFQVEDISKAVRQVLKIQWLYWAQGREACPILPCTHVQVHTCAH